MRHDRGVVLAHRPERIAGMVLAAVGLGAVAVAAKIGRDDGEAPGERRGDLVPADMRQRIAVEEEERRSVAADRDVDLGPLRRDPLGPETVHQAVMPVRQRRSEEHPSELLSLMRTSY